MYFKYRARNVLLMFVVTIKLNKTHQKPEQARGYKTKNYIKKRIHLRFLLYITKTVPN